MLELLTNEELDQVTGGVDAKEYCATLRELAKANFDTWDQEVQESWADAYMTYC